MIVKCVFFLSLQCKLPLFLNVSNTKIKSSFESFLLIDLLQNSSLVCASVTSKVNIFFCLQNVRIKEHQASNCFLRVSKLGWRVKKGGNEYCQGHSKAISSSEKKLKLMKKTQIWNKFSEIILNFKIFYKRFGNFKIVKENRISTVIWIYRDWKDQSILNQLDWQCALFSPSGET